MYKNQKSPVFEKQKQLLDNPKRVFRNERQGGGGDLRPGRDIQVLGKRTE